MTRLRARSVRLDAISDPVTVAQLAGESGFSRRQVRRSINQLVAAGWLEPAGGDRYWMSVPEDDPRGSRG